MNNKVRSTSDRWKRVNWRAATAQLIPIALLSIISAMLTGCAGYVPGRQSYWDAKVKELCAKDGGVTVYERVALSREEYQRLGGNSGALPIPINPWDRPTYPYKREIGETTIRNANPEVVRTEELIRRRSDNKILARSISYSRRGGDFPVGITHMSSFTCPEPVLLSRQIFRVGDDK